MIYHFPHLDTLRLALISGAVPPEAALAPARARQDDGGIRVEPRKALPKKAEAELRRLGVKIEKEGDGLDLEVGHWLQLLPVTADPQAVHLTAQTPVLFDLADAGQLPTLVSEMLRLGNDRQAFRVLKDGKSERVVLRVIGPPYYSLLRALDHDGQAAAPVAYVERKPRVWVRLGYAHPLLETIAPPAGQLLFLDPPRQWSTLAEGPFQDIYEVLEFQLPAAATALKAMQTSAKLTVPLRLAPSGSTEPAELWVLTERAIEQIDSLVHELDDAVVARLAFAVSQQEGAQPVVVLKVRPSKQAPPVLVLDAVGYRSYLKLRNLFVPTGRRLQPPLRRDAVRKLLAGDEGQIVWLSPSASGFIPQQLPDAAFRPLADWVDYVLDHDHESLTAWVQSARFDFEPFICKEEQPAPKPKPASIRKKAGRAEEKGEPAPGAAAPAAEAPARAVPVPPPMRQTPPSELQKQLSELEKRFLSLEGPLDAPERQELWPKLAELNAALDRPADAALCWLNVIWETERLPPALIERWQQSNPGNLEAVLAKTEPSPDDLRALTAGVVHLGMNGAAPAAALVSRARQFLERHEPRLGVRPLWLAWLTLAKLSGNDALGLARARDRILDRLLTGGLSGEQDLPSFLRFERGGDRFRLVRDRLLRLHELARDWSLNCSSRAVRQEAAEPTIAYLDLVFAFGFARLGEQSVSRDVQAQAEGVLGPGDEVHALLYEAFAYRIQQLRAGQEPVGRLPAEFQAKLEVLREPANRETYKELDPRYKIDSLRERSRVLEPQESIDPFARVAPDEVSKEVFAWAAIQDNAVLAERIGKYLQKVRTAESRSKIIKGALRLAPRIGTPLALQLLDLVGPTLNALPAIVAPRDVYDHVELLERALFLAAHHDCGQLVQAFVAKLLFYLNEVQRVQGKFDLIENLVGHSFRGLRKLGLRDQVAGLLARMSDLVFQGQSLEQLRDKLGPESWPTTMVTLLHLASGWMLCGNEAAAGPVLEAARELLLGGQLDRAGGGYLKMKIARACVTTLAQGDTNLALDRIEELFRHMGGFHEIGTWNSHYFMLQIQFIEAVVLAIVSDDFAMGQSARRWLDEDEYLVRRRIHRDVRQWLGQQGG